MLLKKLSKLFFFILLTLITFYYTINNLGYFFDISEEPLKSDLILCLGGGKTERITKTIQLYKNNFSKKDKILLSNIDSNINNQNLITLSQEGIKKENIILTSITRNTYEELLFTKKLMIENKYESIIIISDEPHSRRIKILLNTFLKFPENKLSYTIVGSNVPWWEKKQFYKHKRAIYFVVNESFKIIYNIVFYTISAQFNFKEETLNKLENIKKEFIKIVNNTITYLLK